MFQSCVPLARALVLAGSVVVIGCGESSRPVPPTEDLAPVSGGTDVEASATAAFPNNWIGGFEAGAYADEQLWLLPFEGSPVAAMTFNDDPMPGRVSSTLGYNEDAGHIGAALFDAVQQRLIVSNREQSGSFVRWLNLRTGSWATLDVPGDPTLRSTERGPVILSSDGEEVTVTAGVGVDFETVGRVTLPAETTARTLRLLRYLFGGSDRLLLSGIRQFERRGGAWQPLPSPLPSQAELLWATASPDAIRLCAIAVDGSGWLVDDSGARAVDLPFPSDHCGFSPDGSRAAFTGRPGRNELRVTDLSGTALADFDSLYLQANIDDFNYGTNGKNLVRLDWRTLELVTLPSPSHWCENPQGEDGTVWHDVQLVGSVAVVEQHCRCTDCHVSGVYLLSLSPGASAQPLIAPTEWQILQISALSGGSALIAHSWRTSASEFEGGDSLLQVFSDGSVAEIGPFPQLPTPLHAPLAAPSWGR